MKRHIGVVAILALATLLCALPALAQVAPDLGAARQFGVLGNSGVTGSADPGTIVQGDVGSYPTASISNFPPSTAAPPFTVHNTADAAVQQARAAANAAYGQLAGQGSGTVLSSNQLAGRTLSPGIYSFPGDGQADLESGGTLTLNGDGIFIFQVTTTLTANTLSNIIGSADPCNVYWRVGTSATLNGLSFRGNVLADASITVGAGNVAGKLLAGTGATGAVTMATGGNTVGGCTAAVVIPPTDPAAIPTLGFFAMAALVLLLGAVGFKLFS